MSDDSFDVELLRWLDEHRIRTLTSAALHLKHAGETPWVIGVAVAVFVVVVVLTRAWRAGVAIALSVFAAGMASGILKEVFERVRPSRYVITQVDGYAMPSSHAAATAAAVAALLLAVRWHSRRVLAVVVAVTSLALMVIGVAMIYLGAHWASDVLVGWVLGLVVGAVIGLALRSPPRTNAR